MALRLVPDPPIQDTVEYLAMIRTNAAITFGEDSASVRELDAKLHNALRLLERRKAHT